MEGKKKLLKLFSGFHTNEWLMHFTIHGNIYTKTCNTLLSLNIREGVRCGGPHLPLQHLGGRDRRVSVTGQPDLFNEFQDRQDYVERCCFKIKNVIYM